MTTDHLVHGHKCTQCESAHSGCVWGGGGRGSNLAVLAALECTSCAGREGSPEVQMDGTDAAKI